MSTDEHLLESTQKLEEQQLAWKIDEIKQKAGVNMLPPKGSCHDCGEPFAENDPHKDVKKFCDSICEDGWQEWFRAQKRKHGPNFRPQSSY
jgi:hypothetical protein